MKKGVIEVVIFVIYTSLFAGCLPATPLPTTSPAAATNGMPVSPTPGQAELYLGQKPPGMEPVIFAPGIVSDPDATEYSGTFSPDGSEYYFYRFTNSSNSKILFSKFTDGKWTAPEQLPVTAAYQAFEPHLTNDNHWLFFAWDHPNPDKQPGDNSGFEIYASKRTKDGWSDPKYAGQGMFVSSSRDGQLFITDMSDLFSNRRTYLARLSQENGVFKNYERLSVHAPFGNPAHPCIAPDGSYLLFDVEQGNYLFVSFKQADGIWGEPIDLTKHGFDRMAGGAYVSPDGKYLFFALRGDIWWVDSQVIEDLRK